MAKQTQINTREYTLDLTGKVYHLPEYACVFCKHCTDVWYDSTGIHNIFCENNCRAADVGNYPAPICEDFEPEGESK